MAGISIKSEFSCGQNGVSPQSTGKRGCARGSLTLLQSGSTSTKTSRTISSSSVPSDGPWRPAVTGNRRHRKGDCTIMLAAAASSMTLFTRLTTRPGNNGGERGEGGRTGQVTTTKKFLSPPVTWKTPCGVKGERVTAPAGCEIRPSVFLCGCVQNYIFISYSRDRARCAFWERVANRWYVFRI